MSRTLKRVFLFVLALLALLLLGATAAFAADSAGFVTNIQTLISQASGWVCGLAGGAGGLMTAYHAVMRNLNDDPQAVAHHTGSMKKVLTGTAIACGASGIVAIVTSAFGGGGTQTGMLLLHAVTRVLC